MKSASIVLPCTDAPGLSKPVPSSVKNRLDHVASIPDNDADAALSLLQTLGELAILAARGKDERSPVCPLPVR